MPVAGGTAWRPDGAELAVAAEGQITLVDPARRSVVRRSSPGAPDGLASRGPNRAAGDAPVS